jgi:TonB-dependent SusC/RagA subfamily outer membrane receptor
VAAALVALAALPASAQTGGTIAGRVTDAQSNGALSGASVTIGGTTRRTVTNAQGEYRITGVPAGTYAVTVALIGRQGSTRQVRVANGETATANFTLGANAVAIEGLVVTATGEQARAREVGVAVGRVNVAEDVELAAVNDVSQVLQGRTAGVTVLQASGTSGTGARVRIRGSNSVSLSNDPLLVIDGVRTDPSSSGLAVGGQTTSRLTDLNPEEIESIEVLKGPAAAALYGTAAANGVLVVTTKKGRAGRTQFRGYTELGSVRDVTAFPDNVNGFCSYDAPTATNPTRRLDTSYCDIGTQADEFFVSRNIRLDSIVRFNPLEDSRTTPFETGQRTKVGLSASGGTERVTYFLSGDRDYEGGVYKYDLSTIGRTSLRANLRGQITDKFDLTVNTGFVNSEIRLPQNDNNALGVVSGSLLSTRFRYDSASAGYGFGIRPDQIALINTRENINASPPASWATSARCRGSASRASSAWTRWSASSSRTCRPATCRTAPRTWKATVPRAAAAAPRTRPTSTAPRTSAWASASPAPPRRAFSTAKTCCAASAPRARFFSRARRRSRASPPASRSARPTSTCAPSARTSSSRSASTTACS